MGTTNDMSEHEYHTYKSLENPHKIYAYTYK